MSGGTRLGPGQVADVIGHGVLVFAFVPVVAALPRWAYLEWTNPLDWSDPIVLAFLPVRAAILLVNAFADGCTNGVVGGLFYGVLLCAWLARRPAPAGAGRFGVGAVCGFAGAALMVLATFAWAAARGHAPSVPWGPVAFELGSGVTCGVLAVAGALRLARAGTTDQRSTNTS